MIIKASGIQVRKYESELDYSTNVESTFQKFKQGAEKEYKAKFYPSGDMNHVEAAVLDLVARLYPEIFLSLDNYRFKNIDYLDDLVRIYQILDQATPDSIIIMNKIFTSTALEDAILLGTKVLQKIIELGPLCICLTFIDELASLGEQTVSMASTVVPENSASRTFERTLPLSGKHTLSPHNRIVAKARRHSR